MKFPGTKQSPDKSLELLWYIYMMKMLNLYFQVDGLQLPPLISLTYSHTLQTDGSLSNKAVISLSSFSLMHKHTHTVCTHTVSISSSQTHANTVYPLCTHTHMDWTCIIILFTRNKHHFLKLVNVSNDTICCKNKA